MQTIPLEKMRKFLSEISGDEVKKRPLEEEIAIQRELLARDVLQHTPYMNVPPPDRYLDSMDRRLLERFPLMYVGGSDEILAIRPGKDDYEHVLSDMERDAFGFNDAVRSSVKGSEARKLTRTFFPKTSISLADLIRTFFKGIERDERFAGYRRKYRDRDAVGHSDAKRIDFVIDLKERMSKGQDISDEDKYGLAKEIICRIPYVKLITVDGGKINYRDPDVGDGEKILAAMQFDPESVYKTLRIMIRRRSGSANYEAVDVPVRALFGDDASYKRVFTTCFPWMENRPEFQRYIDQARSCQANEEKQDAEKTGEVHTTEVGAE